MNPIPSLLKLPSLLLLLAVLLGQAALYAHELEHAMEGEQDSCIVCLIGDHQSVLPGSDIQPIPRLSNARQCDTANAGIALQARICYSSRAPPLA